MSKLFQSFYFKKIYYQLYYKTKHSFEDCYLACNTVDVIVKNAVKIKAKKMVENI